MVCNVPGTGPDDDLDALTLLTLSFEPAGRGVRKRVFGRRRGTAQGATRPRVHRRKASQTSLSPRAVGSVARREG